MAYIFNISFFIEPNVENEFLDWVETSFVPQMKSAPGFLDVMVTEVISQVDENNDTRAYGVQAKCDTTDVIAHWEVDTLANLITDMFARFGESVLPLPTVMRILY